MDYKSIFVPGLLALGSEDRKKDLDVAKDILENMKRLSNDMSTKLIPYAFYFTDYYHSNENYFYYLRPELVESYFYLYNVTKEDKYRSNIYYYFYF